MPKTTTTMRSRKPKPEYVTKPMLDEALATLTATLTASLTASFTEAISAANTGLEHRLSAELASHTKAIMEYVAGLIRVVDDKYADLPGRVAALEAKVTG